MFIRSCLAAVAICASLSFGPSLRAASGEKAAFTFDGQEFFLRSTEGEILEYLPADETFKNWTALISVREFAGTSDPKAYAQKLIDNAKASSPNAQGQLMENEEAGSYIADFLLPDGKGDDVGFEWNLWRVEQKGDGVEAVQYALRIPAGSGVGANEIIAAREKIVPELAVFELPAANGATEDASTPVVAGDSQTYAYPDADEPQFSMELPADWTVETDSQGAWIVAADKKFTTSVAVINPADVADAVESIKEQTGGRFASIAWSETVAPQTDPATGVTFRATEGSAKDKGVKYQVGIYVFSKKGSAKTFILATWAPDAQLSANNEAMLYMLSSAKLY